MEPAPDFPETQYIQGDMKSAPVRRTGNRRSQEQLQRVQRIAQDFLRKDPEAVEPIMERWLGDSRNLGSV